MSATDTMHATINEDGTVTILGRLTARDGSGAASPTATEGNLLQQADLSAIQVKVFDLGSATPDTATTTLASGTDFNISDVVYDTIQTSGIWGLINGGGNYLHDLSATYFSASSRQYLVEVKFTTTGSTVAFGRWQLSTAKTYGS